MTSVIAPTSHVGFDSIMQQIERRMLKRGFQFNLMVVGQSGLGKSTLINTLFAAQLATSSGRRSASEPIGRTSEIKEVSHFVEENGVRLNLTIVDTPGYGDQVNNEKCWDPIVKYIKDQHSVYLRKELTAQREKHLPDTRVHCVLFFIQPTGHGLRPIDIVVLKKLTEIANVVPVIAKSDSLTLAERAAFKSTIQAEFNFHKLRLYPYDNEEYDEQERQNNEAVRARIPFAIVGSDKSYTINGKQVRARRNRWGLVNVEDEGHCEFPSLRTFLMQTHLQDLIDTTSHIHYESFRSKQLMALKENSQLAQQQQQPPAAPPHTAGSALQAPRSVSGPGAVPVVPAKN
jgi:septin 3/9/12